MIKTSILAACLLLLSGCFLNNQNNDLIISTLNAESGDEVEVYAREGGKKYRWKQLSGVSVVIANKRSSVLKFTAPTVTEKTDLVFKLNAKFDDPIHDQITISVYPILIINGVRLPPEPNEEENNATLVGIDSNDNGVRDDVERAIYVKYPTKIRQQVLMQGARGHQLMIADPDGVENAVKWQELLSNNTLACSTYLYRSFNIDFDIESLRNLSKLLYNTEDRVKKYLRYNHALSGGVYGVEEEEKVEGACEFNVSEAIGVQ
jgi:hypothetical protein